MDKKKRFRQIIEDEGNALLKISENIDYDVLCQIADLFCKLKRSCGKVIVAGCGTAGMAAKRVAHTMCVVEIPSFFLSPADAIHGGMGAMNEADILVLFSKSGNTQEVLNYIHAAKVKGLTIIGVTSNEASKLGKESDILLRVNIGKEPDKWGIISSASTLAFVSVFDAVAFVVMEETGYKKEEFYLIHTGGGVGEILRNEGADYEQNKKRD